jgi:putative ATP-dependent endonuclease of the OLD family
MKIESVRIKNFRGFSDVIIPFNNYTCLVGSNGSGKSTVLCALNVFFRETANATTDLNRLYREDFHKKNTGSPVEITLTFVDLSAEAKVDFSNYCRHNKLVVSAIATFDDSANCAEIKQYGQRLVMPEFRDFFRAVGDNKLVPVLKDLYNEIRTKITSLPTSGTKAAMIDALRKHEEDHQERCALEQSEDQFYGVTKGANRLNRYLQWVYVPAVKDASSEQLEQRNTALGTLLQRTVRAKTDFGHELEMMREEAQAKYKSILDKKQDALKELSSSMGTRIGEWAHPGATVRLEWYHDPDSAVRIDEPYAKIIAGEDDFEGELGRFGHGLQRSYLLALLQELSGSDDGRAPKLVLGCEEPELYQHPPQARHLAGVLQKLSEGNSQIIICTHSPLFVSGEGFEDVRLVRKDAAKKESDVRYITYPEISAEIALATGKPVIKASGTLAKMNQLLQPSVSEMFFATRLVLVEGLEDVAYINAYLHLLGKWDTYRRIGGHIVPVNGKNQLLQPLIIAKKMHIPTFLIFDCDGQETDPDKRKMHEKDNRALLSILGNPGEDPLPVSDCWGPGFVVWHSEIGDIVRDEIGIADWQRFQEAANRDYGHAGSLQKNTLHITASLAYAWDEGKKSASLERLCTQILDTSNSVKL